MPEHLGQFRQRVVGVGHLDGAHAEQSGRLEIDAEVVEEHRLLRLDVERGAGELVKARIWFADAEHAGFEDRIEQRVHLGHRLGDDTFGRHEIVGEAGRLVGLPPGVDGGDHLRPDIAGEPLEHEPPIELVAERAGLGRPGGGEGVDVDLAPFQAGPGIVVGVGRIDAADEPGRQAALGFQVGERLERAGRDDTAEVEHHRSYRHTLPSRSGPLWGRVDRRRMALDDMQRPQTGMERCGRPRGGDHGSRPA